MNIKKNKDTEYNLKSNNCIKTDRSLSPLKQRLFRGETQLPLLVFKSAHELAVHVLRTALRCLFRPKMHTNAGFCLYTFKNFPGMISPCSHRSAPGAWTQTPIYGGLASVPIVPVLRNETCCQDTSAKKRGRLFLKLPIGSHRHSLSSGSGH